MNVNTRNRFIVFGILTVALFAVLFVQLARLTLVQGEELAAKSAELKQREITVAGARGSILDRNGLPLAYDVKSYNVQFYRDPTKNTETDRAYYTSVIMKMIDIVEKNGGKTVDTFAIKRDEKTGEYYFDFGIKNEENKQKREEEWRKNMYVTSDSLKTVEQIYLFLRNKYQIPSEMGFEDAAKILSVWQDVQLSSWVAYKPVDVAYNVSTQTVAEIQTYKDELTGMSIEDSTSRVYPKGAVAAHVIGYMGRITEDTVSDVNGYGYVDNDHYTQDELNRAYNKSEDGAVTGAPTLQDIGYSVDDLIGVNGVEKSMEAYLTGNRSSRQGKQVVEIDNMAVVQNVLSSTQPSQGDNVMLTIDLPLQQVVEKSLADNIPKIREAQIAAFNDPKNAKKYEGKKLDELDLAESGAVVVMDVHSGDVLAMASNPSFDLNLFTGGIDEETYKALSTDKTAPLFNKAIASKATPGSIFKMVTGLGALMEGELDPTRGTTLTETITCEGTYTKDIINLKDAPSCWKTHGYETAHANQDIVKGLEHSCNFYFYTLAGRMGIDLLDKWTEKFGLTSSTGIQLPGEAVGQVGSQKQMFNPYRDIDEQSSALPVLVWKTGQYSVVKLITDYAKGVERTFTEEEIEDAAKEIVYLMGISWHTDEDTGNTVDADKVTIGKHIRDILYDKLGISQKVSVQLSRDIASSLSELMWTPALTVRTGIGQGITAVTPIAVARYISAIVNGGTVYQANIIDKIVAQDGTVVLDQQPEVFGTLDANPVYLEKLIEGMSSVVSAEEGTAQDFFSDWEYQLQIGGKTGTAQVSTTDLENNSWFVCFAPYSKEDPTVEPEIAVVVYVPHGYQGGQSCKVARDILQYYLDQKKVVAEQTIPDSDSLVYGAEKQGI
jgi:penicillin-binding protein 2